MSQNDNKSAVESPIGFADSNVVRLQKFDDKLIVILKTWNDETLEVSFFGVIGFRESMALALSDLIKTNEIGQFGEWCRIRAYEGNHSGGELNYQFLDVNSEVAIEIIATGLQIRIIDGNHLK